MTPWAIPLVALVAVLWPHDKPADRVVLLPQADGSKSAVVVRSAAGEAVLDQPYAAVDVAQRGALTSAQTDAEAVRARFGAALAAQPPRPVSYVVYFVTGKDELTPQSQPVLEQVKAELARRPAPEITVIGHTDRVGGVAENDRLSLQRATFVKQALQSAGIDARQIDVAGRGEREPVVPTADEVDEPRNRRVEINIR